MILPPTRKPSILVKRSRTDQSLSYVFDIVRKELRGEPRPAYSHFVLPLVFWFAHRLHQTTHAAAPASEQINP